MIKSFLNRSLSTSVFTNSNATKNELEAVLGFNPKKIKSESGMGLGSIKKRVEHLNGSFQIDTALKRGTSIIINIPT